MKRVPTHEREKAPAQRRDLREGLIEAGLELLREDGVAGLTLRRCAARAGVSHAAPAYHFDGLPGLLAAIVTRGFERFTEAMVRAREAASDDPRGRLVGICEGYLHFARENEALFELMFTAEGPAFDDPDLEHVALASYQVLADACAPFGDGPGRRAITELMVWSLVQGFATLSRKRHLHPDGSSIHEVAFDDLLPPLALRA